MAIRKFFLYNDVVMKNKCILFIDIGNTAIDILLTDFVFKKQEKMPILDKDKIRKTIVEFEKDHKIEGAYIASVNKGCQAFVSRLFDSLAISTHFLDGDTMLSFCKDKGYTVDNTSYLGADLFCGIIAHEEKNGLLILDVGTATKILFLDKDKVFHGACILPGLFSFPEILYQDTSLLGKNPLLDNPPLVSLDTKECISSGAINGQAALLASMSKEILKQYHSEQSQIYLTGGNCSRIETQLHRFGLSNYILDKNLVLKGLARSFGFENYAFLNLE